MSRTIWSSRLSVARNSGPQDVESGPSEMKTWCAVVSVIRAPKVSTAWMGYAGHGEMLRTVRTGSTVDLHDGDILIAFVRAGAKHGE